jgi:hypothetical protein
MCIDGSGDVDISRVAAMAPAPLSGNTPAGGISELGRCSSEDKPSGMTCPKKIIKMAYTVAGSSSYVL